MMMPVSLIAVNESETVCYIKFLHLVYLLIGSHWSSRASRRSWTCGTTSKSNPYLRAGGSKFTLVRPCLSLFTKIEKCKHTHVANHYITDLVMQPRPSGKPRMLARSFHDLFLSELTFGKNELRRRMVRFLREIW